MNRAAWALCAALAATSLAAPASADPVTYTFDVTSTVAPRPEIPPVAPPLSLSFTVDGPVSVEATSHFADVGGVPPVAQVAYRFPAALTSFNMTITGTPFSVTLADFLSPRNGLSGFGVTNFPQWSIDLNADPSAGTASLSLFFYDETATQDVHGAPIGSFNPFQISTGTPGTIYYGSDAFLADAPAQYTGLLVAAPAVPEPSSLLLIGVGLGMLGLVSCAGARRARP